MEEDLYALALFRIEEDAVGAHQLEAVPRGRVVAGGDDDRALGIERRDHQLGSGRGARAHVDDAATRLAQERQPQLGQKPIQTSACRGRGRRYRPASR